MTGKIWSNANEDDVVSNRYCCKKFYLHTKLKPNLKWKVFAECVHCELFFFFLNVKKLKQIFSQDVLAMQGHKLGHEYNHCHQKLDKKHSKEIPEVSVFAIYNVYRLDRLSPRIMSSLQFAFIICSVIVTLMIVFILPVSLNNFYLTKKEENYIPFTEVAIMVHRLKS